LRSGFLRAKPEDFEWVPDFFKSWITTPSSSLIPLKRKVTVTSKGDSHPMEALLFYPFAGLAVLGALGVIALAKPTRALLSLIVTMFALAVLFLQLQATFVAMVHLVVYAGAVLVLFLFVIMLMGMGGRESGLIPARKIFLGLAFFVPLAFLGFLLALVPTLDRGALRPVEGAPETLGMLLFTRYLLPFELVSFLLLIGVFAAVTLSAPPQGAALRGARPQEKI
jgi:NADH-quinone oxidoreductase subunit J